MDDQPNPPRVEQSPAKRFGRRRTLKLLAATASGMAAAVVPTASRQQPLAPVPAAPQPSAKGRVWRLRPLVQTASPRVFSATELRTLGAVVDRIIPDTDTPGARTAGVHLYLDDVCAVEHQLAGQIRRGRARVEALARRRGAPFADLPPAGQDAILRMFDRAAGVPPAVDRAGQPRLTAAAAGLDAITPEDRSFFALIRTRTIDAYYKSEMGQIGELEWVGHEFHDSFPGKCEHADPLHHPRPRWPRSRA